jgi:hypothetical protein
MLSRNSISVPSRTTLVTLLFVGILAMTGCLGFVTGDGPLKIASEDVAVSDSALSATDYELVRKKTIGINENVTVADQTRSVKSTTHLRVYTRDVNPQIAGVTLSDDVPITRFMVLSTPKAEIAGQSLNPIGHLQEGELVQRFLQEYEDIDNIQFVGNQTIQSLGEERTISTFSATIQVAEGVEMTATLNVAAFEHGDDYITVMAIYPSQIDEQMRIKRLLKGLEHPA